MPHGPAIAGLSDDNFYHVMEPSLDASRVPVQPAQAIRQAVPYRLYVCFYKIPVFAKSWSPLSLHADTQCRMLSATESDDADYIQSANILTVDAVDT